MCSGSLVMSDEVMKFMDFMMFIDRKKKEKEEKGGKTSK